MESWSFDDESVSTADAIAGGKMVSMDWESKSPFIFGYENQGFGEMYFPQTVGNSLVNPVMAATHYAFSEENESSSSKITNNLSSTEVSMPPFCQVHGCNKSLVSCKDYHKRHKVCEVHSKTAKVIVRGIEQRFCQQCSRFHLLSEFDDGKRSCRKRLADHNERRRKPHVGGHSGRHGRLLQSYNITRDAGSKFKGPTRARATSSSMYHDIWHIKLEDEMSNDLRRITDVQLHSESSSCNFGRQYPSLHGDGNGYTWGSDPTSGADDFVTMDSRSALSLLSSRNSLVTPFNHNAHRASGVSNNMNPLLGSEYMNPKSWVWSGDGSTINLLQLSSELERVEYQKEIFSTKCSNGASVGLSIT